jgi:RNA polymerase sigma-70 factor (ECF subfamily)
MTEARFDACTHAASKPRFPPRNRRAVRATGSCCREGIGPVFRDENRDAVRMGVAVPHAHPTRHAVASEVAMEIPSVSGFGFLPASLNGEAARPSNDRAQSSSAEDPRTEVRRTNEAVVAAYAILMKAHCGRVYRIVRSILSDPAEIEDVMHQAYVSTFVQADGDPVRDSSWLCRVALNEAMARIRQRGRFVSLEEGAAASDKQLLRGAETVVTQIADVDIIRVFENVVGRLSEIYRTVLIMRDVEGMTATETAAVLNVDVETVKVRVQQGRSLIKGVVKGYNSDVFRAAFPLQEEVCARVTAGVTDTLGWMLHLTDRKGGGRSTAAPLSSGHGISGRA